MRLIGSWRDASKAWFGGSMIEPYILLTPPGSPNRYGETASVGSFGEPMEIRLRPSLLDGTHPKVHGDPEGCYRFVADVLLHEMIHQWQIEVISAHEEAWHWHGPQFTGQCNLIGASLGLAPVVTRNRNGSRLPRSAQWPHCVRPPEYYLGAYDPDGGTPDATEETITDPPDIVPCPHCAGTGSIAAPRAQESARENAP
jgi:hypothetical protein